MRTPCPKPDALPGCATPRHARAQSGGTVSSGKRQLPADALSGTKGVQARTSGRRVPENPRIRFAEGSGESTIAALYVQPDGCYANLPGVDVWDQARDARTYGGPHPVVAHPPCQLWVKFAKVNFVRWGGEHNRPGNDGGCFAAALEAVRRWGGVLEHPAFSYAWTAFALPRPKPGRWLQYKDLWVAEVWQSAYGHRANKRTWLAYCGQTRPPELSWSRPEGTHQIGGMHAMRGPDRNKPTISGKAASATPPAFRDVLLSIARSAPVTSEAAA